MFQGAYEFTTIFLLTIWAVKALISSSERHCCSHFAFFLGIDLKYVIIYFLWAPKGSSLAPAYKAVITRKTCFG
jgi:hypothetical protein